MEERPTTKDEFLKELRERFEWLDRFTDDELREISICVDSGRLSESDQYVDLSDPERGVIKAKAGDPVPPGACYISRDDVSDELWTKLLM